MCVKLKKRYFSILLFILHLPIVVLFIQVFYCCVFTSFSFSFSKGERAVLYLFNKHLHFQISIFSLITKPLKSIVHIESRANGVKISFTPIRKIGTSSLGSFIIHFKEIPPSGIIEFLYQFRCWHLSKIKLLTFWQKQIFKAPEERNISRRKKSVIKFLESSVGAECKTYRSYGAMSP